jgi:hypothetical protein
MKASKFLVSTAAAITVVGTIGLVYAQTGTSTPPGTYTSPQTQSQATPPGQPAAADPSMNQRPSAAGGMNRDSTSTTRSGTGGNPSNDPGAMSSERVARADRN